MYIYGERERERERLLRRARMSSVIEALQGQLLFKGRTDKRLNAVRSDSPKPFASASVDNIADFVKTYSPNCI